MAFMETCTRCLQRFRKKIAVDWVNCIGVGITAEAVEHNAMLYEIFTDLFFNGHFRAKAVAAGFNHLDNGNYGAFAYLPKNVDPLPIEQWVHEYALQRTGAFAPPTVGLLSLSSSSSAEELVELQQLSNEFYKLLEQVFYRDTDTHLFMRTFMDAQPRFPPSKLELPSKAVKSFKGALHATRLGLKIARLTDAGNALKYRPIHTDLVDLIGTIAHAWFDVTYTCYAQLHIVKESFKKDPVTLPTDEKGVPMKISYVALASLNRTIMTLYDTIDEILRSNPNYLLGRWIGNARALAKDLGTTNQNPEEAGPVDLSEDTLAKEADLYEFNARNQVTVWGEASSKGLDGYARKLWAGLYKDFYKMRHGMVLDMLSQENPPIGANKLFDDLRGDSYAWVTDPSSKFKYAADPTDSANGDDTVELIRGMIRNLVLLSHQDIEKEFETMTPDNILSAEENRGVSSITVPDEVAIVPFMASLCHRSIGPMCLGFDPTRKLVFVQVVVSKDRSESKNVNDKTLVFKQDGNKESKDKIYIRRK